MTAVIIPAKMAVSHNGMKLMLNVNNTLLKRPFVFS